MKLKPIETNSPELDRETLVRLVESYREFVGTKAAFHIEYLWWPGEFETKHEEADFFLSEHSYPDSYETVEKWHDEATFDLAACDVAMADVKFSRGFWRVVAALLAIPYLVLFYLWRTGQ